MKPFSVSLKVLGLCLFVSVMPKSSYGVSIDGGKTPAQDSLSWYQVDDGNMVVMDNISYKHEAVGLRHYLVAQSGTKARKEALYRVNQGTTEVCLIAPLKQGNPVIKVSGDDAFLLKDITLRKLPTSKNNLLIGQEALPEPHTVSWLRNKSFKTWRNADNLYIDEFGSFYHKKNCYDAATQTGVLFQEVYDGGRVRVFYLVNEKDVIGKKYIFN